MAISTLLIVLIIDKINNTPFNQPKFAGRNLLIVDSITAAAREKLDMRFDDTIINNDSLLVLGNNKGDTWTKKWFKPKKSFQDYPVREIYYGDLPTKLNYRTSSWGRMYKTMTEFGLKDGVAFAGHYAFAGWRCGSNCQGCNIIDLYSGNVYAGPDAENGYEFRVDSWIIVVNPPDTNGIYDDCAYCKPEQYLWTGSSFKRLE